MSRAACRTGLLIIFLVPMGALGQAAPEAALASASVQRVPIPDRSAVMPILDCAKLVQHDFSTVAEAPTRVQSAAIEAATAERAEFCLVKGYVAPTIQFELRLPTTRWTGRYLQGGCGGNCGVILSGVAPRCDIQIAYAGSFAVGFENSGHSGGDGVWALGGQSVREDFAFRAAHAFSVAAKAIMSVYYGRPPEFSYFQGCSDGGREAMMETKRYPADFNGVIAGSPAFAIAEAMERFIWEARWGREAQGSLGCRGGQSPPQCLTAPQAEVARKLYAGPVDENGRHLFYGGEPYGSELSWVERYALPIMGAAMFDDAVQNMIFQHAPDSAASVQAWRFDAQTFGELSRRGAGYAARSADLRGVRERGGKLILWQGFADPAAGAYGLPDYYYRLSREVGGFEAARRFARMFLIPGVYHCAGGYVPYEEDLLGALVSWVELGHAPDSVMATASLKEGASRSRPVFAYPVQSRYRGRGDVNDPRNFAASTPKSAPMDLYDWAGAPSNNP